MSREQKTIAINKSQDEECRIPCRNCHVETRHRVLQSVDISGREYSRGELYFAYDDSYQIVQCQGCDDISFRQVHFNSEDFEHDPETDEVVSAATINVYPNRVSGRHKLRQAHFLPFEVSRIYSETHAALCSKQPILAGIGIRALVEAVCQLEEAEGSNLEKKIDSLMTRGILTKAEAEHLHSMRILGNTAAHEVKPHSEIMLSLAMDVVEHLLTTVYILPAATDQLPKRKKSD